MPRSFTRLVAPLVALLAAAALAPTSSRLGLGADAASTFAAESKPRYFSMTYTGVYMQALIDGVTLTSFSNMARNDIGNALSGAASAYAHVVATVEPAGTDDTVERSATVHYKMMPNPDIATLSYATAEEAQANAGGWDIPSVLALTGTPTWLASGMTAPRDYFAGVAGGTAPFPSMTITAALDERDPNYVAPTTEAPTTKAPSGGIAGVSTAAGAAVLAGLIAVASVL